MASLFSKIISGDIPSYNIAENDQFFAFLDIRPMAKGHTLVVPKFETDVFFDLPEAILSDIMPFCKSVGQAIQSVVDCNRIGVSVMGLEVPHAHVHLIPITKMKDMSFDKDPLSMTNTEMFELAASIERAWELISRT